LTLASARVPIGLMDKPFRPEARPRCPKCGAPMNATGYGEAACHFTRKCGYTTRDPKIVKMAEEAEGEMPSLFDMPDAWGMNDVSTKEGRVAQAVAYIKEAVRKGGHMAQLKMGTLKHAEWAEALERVRAEGFIILHDVVTVIAPGHEEKIAQARE
jgi:hypothetical protein